MIFRRRSLDGRTIPDRVRRRRRPSLEALEERVVLSAFTVTSLADASPPAGVLTLRQAIADANADGNTNPAAPDIIKFAVSGTIDLDSELPAITGSLSIQGPGESSLTIQLANPDNTPAGFQFFSIAQHANAAISGITINGEASANAFVVGQGAGLSVSNTAIESTGLGSNINNPPAAILANQDAGAIAISGSQFTNDFGPSIFDVGAASLTISQSSFTNNTDTEASGTVYIASDSSGNGGKYTISDSLFSGNLAENAGAIELSGGASGTIADSTITGNTAFGNGGGIAVDDLGEGTGPISLTLADSTIAGNTADQSGGGLYVGVTVGALVVDTIVAQNTGSGGAMDDVYGALNAASSFNLIGDGAGVTGLTAFTNGNLIGTASAPINPLLGPLQNNGGPTLTMVPSSASPAIDSGGPSPTTDSAFPTDQRGLPRINDMSNLLNPFGGDGRDIGAVEVQGTFTPTVLTVNTTADASPPAGTLSLREAIEAADGTVPLSSLPASQVKANNSGLFTIELDVTGHIALGSALPALEGNITLVGPGASSLAILGTGQANEPVLSVASLARVGVDNVTIDGDGGSGADGILVGAGAVLSVTSDVFQDTDLASSDMTFNAGILAIAGGSTVTVELSTFDGLRDAGIINGGGAVSVDESTFENILDPSSDGAGVVTWAESGGFGGELTITRSLFENNTTGNGGAVAVLGGSTATIADSTFYNNFAESAGGAIFVGASAPAGGDAGVPGSLTLLRSTIVGNTGSSGGGLFDSTTAPVRLQDTIIVGNTNGSSPNDVYATFTAASSNDLIGVGTGQTGLTNGQDGVHFGTATSPLNPLLGPLQNNGGPTLTMAPLAGSPALDGGSRVVDTGTDQRGVVRGTVIDIGAYQATATRLDVSGFPTSTTTGVSHAFAVSAVDPFGQPSLDFNGPVTFSSSDASAALPTGQSLVAGQGTYSANLSTPGVQSITASAGGLSGSQTGITVSGTPATATFLEKDATTRGIWSGTYGAQGYDIVSGPSSLPAHDTVTPSGELTYTWTTTSTDPRALQVPGSSHQVAAVWYSATSFTVDVNLADGQAHDLELYFDDWDNRGRSEQVQISDAATGTVLDTESISSFTSGVYLDWKVSGNLVITITRTAGVNAVLNGLFLDPTSSPTPTATASFLGKDATTQGSWSGTYGAQGYDIVSGPTSLPAKDTVTPSGELTYTWTTTSTDPRALQVPGSSHRVAAVWYSATTFTVDVNLADGQAHDLELDFDDWDNLGRSEQVQISSAATGTVLDTETISSFTSGVYLNWVVSGNLVITITREAGANAVLNGLFLDPSSTT